MVAVAAELPPPPRFDRLYTLAEAAATLRVLPATVVRWHRAGRCKLHKPGGGKTSWWFMTESELLRLRGLGPPEANAVQPLTPKAGG